jgi:hypothetical protein
MKRTREEILAGDKEILGWKPEGILSFDGAWLLGLANAIVLWYGASRKYVRE